MKPNFPELLTPSSNLLALLVVAAWGLVCPLAQGQQALLDKTTLGSSQNDYRDLQNSLVVPKHTKIGKEKTGEVDLKTLQTKTSKDTPFQGTLMDLDVDWRGEKLGKPVTNSEKDSRTAKSTDTSAANDSKVSKQADASGDKESKSTQAAEKQSKDQKAASATSEQKAAEKEKASKPDGDH